MLLKNNHLDRKKNSSLANSLFFVTQIQKRLLNQNIQGLIQQKNQKQKSLTHLKQSFKYFNPKNKIIQNQYKDLKSQGKFNTLYKENKQKKSQQKQNKLKYEINLQSKWQKMIEIYTMKEQLRSQFSATSLNALKKQCPIMPGIEFYKIMSKDEVIQKQWKINFPETIMIDSENNMIMLYTNCDGILKKKLIEKDGGKQKQDYREEVAKFKNQFINQLISTNKIKKQINLEENINAPLAIIKYTQDNAYQFQTEVQTVRNFYEKKTKPNRDSILQRYIYSRNMKAMVFRLYYRRPIPGKQFQIQFQGCRFQNIKPIFKQNQNTNCPETHKLISTITISQTRLNTIQFSKSVNPRAIQKFINQTKQLKKMLEYAKNVVIDKLYVDFIVDIFDKAWIINIKYCKVNVTSKIINRPLQEQTSNVGSCRLCGIILKKQFLKNSVSIRMLCQFINHLKKRTKMQNQQQIDFINNVNINSKQNKTSNVCETCYEAIIQQLELIKMENKLAKICNIKLQNAQNFHAVQANNNKIISQLKQWRLMIYLDDIKHFNDLNFTNKAYGSNYYIKYQISPKIVQYFCCKKLSPQTLSIRKLKLHYFYSQTTAIQDFINNTQIFISLHKADSEDDIQAKQNLNKNSGANGRTRIISAFKTFKSPTSMKSLMENGQRQTATVLLFFENKKYCELTMKVGLVYDGSYNISSAGMIKTNDVFFSKNVMNSNPLPKEWMQAFSVEKQINEV